MATRQLGAKKLRVLPGFRLTLGYTLLYLSLIVLIPLAAVFWKTSTLSWPQFCHAVASPVALASYRLTFGASFLAALVNAVFGLIVAWVLVRYKFFGKRLVDALVDLPFALPTAVAGITLATLYAENGWIGQFFSSSSHWHVYFHLPAIKISFTRLGVFVALTFIGLPFIVRTVQPVLAEVDAEMEEAARSLGAERAAVRRNTGSTTSARPVAEPVGLSRSERVSRGRGSNKLYSPAGGSSAPSKSWTG